MPNTIFKPKHSETVLTDACLSMMAARPGSLAFNEAHLPPATSEPSELVKASPYLIEMLRLGMDSREVERRARGAQRLKEAYGSLPFHARKAEKYTDYWNNLYASRINW